MSAWTLDIDNMTDGLVPTVDMTARRKCGRVERLTAYLFPAGWRLNAPHVPAAVRSEAKKLAWENSPF